MQIAISRDFVEAMAGLGFANVRTTVSFVNGVLRDPRFGVGESEAKLLCDENGTSVHALRVSDDLRAIARVTGDLLLLMFVGSYDVAYEWARQNCQDCASPSAGIKLIADSLPGKPVLGLPSSRVEGPWHCVLSGPRDLHSALKSAGIAS